MKSGREGDSWGGGRGGRGHCTDMDSRTRARGFTFLQVSGLHIPLFWKVLPLDVHLALSLPPFKSLLKCPFLKGPSPPRPLSAAWCPLYQSGTLLAVFPLPQERRTRPGPEQALQRRTFVMR